MLLLLTPSIKQQIIGYNFKELRKFTYFSQNNQIFNNLFFMQEYQILGSDTINLVELPSVTLADGEVIRRFRTAASGRSDTADFVMGKDNAMMYWSNGEKGISFYPYTHKYKILTP